MMHYHHQGKLIQNDPGFLGKADFFCFLLTLSLFLTLYTHTINTPAPPSLPTRTNTHNYTTDQ
jgi:hypothetical protein